MNAYRQFWLMAAILLSTAIYVVYSGALSWGAQKFPNTMTQAMFALVIAIFTWTFMWLGHKTARRIARNQKALDALERGQIPKKRSEALAYLEKEAELRTKGEQAGQRDFSTLHERQVAAFEEELSEDIGTVDSLQLGLVGFGIFLAILSIVIGLGIVKPPTDIETTGPYLLEIMQALGVAYVPASACFGSFILLLALGSIMNFHIRRVRCRFDDASYSVAFFGAHPKDSLQRYDQKDEAHVPQ